MSIKKSNDNQKKFSIYTPDYSKFQLSEEQKFLFDLKGYVVIPDVFNAEQVAAMKQQVYQITHEPETLQPHERTIPGGASEVIFSSPVVKGALHDLIGPDHRLDTHHVIWRKKDQKDSLAPHQGGPMRNPHFHYHHTGGQIYSALTVMVIELNPVSMDDGGTIFLPGSHKSNFAIPDSLRTMRDDHYEPHFDRYEATPGSIVLFSENTCHAGPVWKNPDHPRVSIFMWFNHIGCRWHRHHKVAPEVIEGLGTEARWYFRDVWPWDNNDSSDRYAGKNVVITNKNGSITTSP